MEKNKKYAPQNFNQQFEEEKRKYELCKDSAWSEAIRNWEDYPCLEGRIKFLLDYCCDDVTKFEEYAEIAVKLLQNENNLFERLLLNQKDSSYPCQLENMKVSNEKQTLFNIISVEQFSFFNKGKSDRDFGWHRLLNDNPDEYKKQRQDSLNACQEAAKNIICKELPKEKKITPNTEIVEWKKNLVKCPKLIKYCTNTILYKVTYKDTIISYYLSTDIRDHFFSKRNKVSELYTRYLYETIHKDGDGWEYATWSYKDNCKVIDPYLKKGEIEIRRKGDYWCFKGLESIDNIISVDELVKMLKQG